MATFEENQTTLETLGEEIEATEPIEITEDKANDTPPPLPRSPLKN